MKVSSNQEQSYSYLSADDSQIAKQFAEQIQVNLVKRQTRIDEALERIQAEQMATLEQIKTGTQALTNFMQQLTSLSQLTSKLRKPEMDIDVEVNQLMQLIDKQQRQISKQKAEIQTLQREKQCLAGEILPQQGFLLNLPGDRQADH